MAGGAGIGGRHPELKKKKKKKNNWGWCVFEKPFYKRPPSLSAHTTTHSLLPTSLPFFFFPHHGPHGELLHPPRPRAHGSRWSGRDGGGAARGDGRGWRPGCAQEPSNAHTRVASSLAPAPFRPRPRHEPSALGGVARTLTPICAMKFWVGRPEGGRAGVKRLDRPLSRRWIRTRQLSLFLSTRPTVRVQTPSLPAFLPPPLRMDQRGC